MLLRIAPQLKKKNMAKMKEKKKDELTFSNIFHLFGIFFLKIHTFARKFSKNLMI